MTLPLTTVRRAAAVIAVVSLIAHAAHADPMEDLVRQCDLVAEVHVISSPPLAKLEINYTDAEWSAKFAAVPNEDKFSKVLPSGSFNGWFDTRTARVVNPVRGCGQSELIKVDFNNLVTETNTPGENVIFDNEERCLVFLKKYPDGHYGVINQKQGKIRIVNDRVPGWRGGEESVTLASVLQQLREWAAAVSRAEAGKAGH
jgi:hypothetical protein